MSGNPVTARNEAISKKDCFVPRNDRLEQQPDALPAAAGARNAQKKRIFERYILVSNIMKKIFFGLLFLLLFMVSSFAMHKFYVSIYQVNQNVSKKRLEVTARLFIDDLNKVLSKQYAKKISVCEPEETKEDVAVLQQYLLEKIIIKINGKHKQLIFKTKELETNVVVCYLIIDDVYKIKSLEIENSALMSLNTEQQNIIQINVLGKKESLLFTTTDFYEMLKF